MLYGILSREIEKLQTVSTLDKYFFTNRVINMSNSLPDSIATAPTLGCF